MEYEGQALVPCNILRIQLCAAANLGCACGCPSQSLLSGWHACVVSVAAIVNLKNVLSSQDLAAHFTDARYGVQVPDLGQYFKFTETQPMLYWLPLTDEQMKAKAAAKQKAAAAKQ